MPPVLNGATFRCLNLNRPVYKAQIAFHSPRWQTLEAQEKYGLRRVPSIRHPQFHLHFPHRRLTATAACRLTGDGSLIRLMDPSAVEPGPPLAAAGVGTEPVERCRRRRGTAVRGVLGVAFPIAASFLFSFLVGIAGLALGGLSSTASVSLPSTCRILSTGRSLFLPFRPLASRSMPTLFLVLRNSSRVLNKHEN